MGADRVVLGDSARPVAVQPHGPHQPLDVTAGHMPQTCRTETSGRFSIACILRVPTRTAVVRINLPDLSLHALITHRPGTGGRDLAAQVALGAILCLTR